MVNSSFEKVSQFICLRTTVTIRNLIQEEIRWRLNLGSANYLSVQNLLSSCLPCKNKRIRTYKTIIKPVVLYGSETWSLALRGEHRLRVFEVGVLRRIFGLKRNEVTGGLRKQHNENLHNLHPSPSIIIIIKSKGKRWIGRVAQMG
jgi:hypothetical protein